MTCSGIWERLLKMYEDDSVRSLIIWDDAGVYLSSKVQQKKRFPWEAFFFTLPNLAKPLPWFKRLLHWDDWRERNLLIFDIILFFYTVGTIPIFDLAGLPPLFWVMLVIPSALGFHFYFQWLVRKR